MARINIHESTEPSIQNAVYPLNRRPLGERQHIGILRTAIKILISSSNWFVFISEAGSDGDCSSGGTGTSFCMEGAEDMQVVMSLYGDS